VDYARRAAVLPNDRAATRPSCRAELACSLGVSAKSAQIARFPCVSSRFGQRRVRKTHLKSIHECEKRQRASLVTIVALIESIGLSDASIIPKTMLNAHSAAPKLIRIHGLARGYAATYPAKLSTGYKNGLLFLVQVVFGCPRCPRFRDTFYFFTYFFCSQSDSS